MNDRFKQRRDFIHKSIVLTLGVGVSGNLTLLDEVMKNADPLGLKKNDLDKLLETSPKMACGGKKGDPPKEGCCGWSDGWYQCYQKK